MLASLFRKPDPDAPLVAAAARGDMHAFDMLVRRYQERLGLFVRARLGPAIDADDVSQEIFVAAWKELPRFQGRSLFKTWLFGIAVNRCAEAARRQRPLRLIVVGLEGPDEVSSPFAAHPESEDWSAALAQREQVRGRLGELPELERQVLELYYYADLNLPEISRLLNINLSTLKYRFYQAHRRMRGLLEAAEQDPSPESHRSVAGRREHP